MVTYSQGNSLRPQKKKGFCISEISYQEVHVNLPWEVIQTTVSSFSEKYPG